MKKFLKKIFYMGVDLTAQSVEKFESTIKELVEKGEIPAKKGEKIIAKFIKKTEKNKDYLEAKIVKVIQKASLKKKGIKNILTDEELKETLKIRESK
jgi:polyhydroxyalkanoate synthesis regulator phasin